jgi:hypothetical protein
MIQARQKKLASFSISTKPPSMHPRNECSVSLHHECLKNAGPIKTIEHTYIRGTLDGFPKKSGGHTSTCTVYAPGHATPRTRLLGLWDSFSSPSTFRWGKVIDNDEWRTLEFPVLGTVSDKTNDFEFSRHDLGMS